MLTLYLLSNYKKKLHRKLLERKSWHHASTVTQSSNIAKYQSNYSNVRSHWLYQTYNQNHALVHRNGFLRAFPKTELYQTENCYLSVSTCGPCNYSNVYSLSLLLRARIVFVTCNLRCNLSLGFSFKLELERYNLLIKGCY